MTVSSDSTVFALLHSVSKAWDCQVETSAVKYVDIVNILSCFYVNSQNA